MVSASPGADLAPLLVMPAQLQRVFLWITILASAVVLAFAARMAKKHASFAPVWLVVAGFACISMEPMVTFLGHNVHPRIGQITLFETFNRPIPWHIALGYMAGFGAFYLVIFEKWTSGRLAESTIWKITLITALCFFLGEAIPVENGLWVYYGYQPLWFWKGTAPPLWGLLNATSMLTSATAMLLALPHLRGMSQVLLVPLGVAGSFMGHVGAGYPMYNAMNANAPSALVEGGGLLTVGMAGLVVWLCAKVLLPRSPQAADGR